jgi:hypothetical protein
MAETSSPRFGMVVWGAGTDGPSRTEFNQSFDAIDDFAARYDRGLRAARPAASIYGRFYYATDTGVLYHDTGTAWTIVGAGLEAPVSVASGATGDVVLTLKGFTGQTADLLALRDGTNALQSRFGSSGSLYVGQNAEVIRGTGAGYTAKFTAQAAAGVPLIVKGMASQSGNLFEARDTGDAILARIDNVGRVYGVGLTSSSGLTVSSGASALQGLTAGATGLGNTTIEPGSNASASLQVDGIAGQTNLQTWRNASDAVVGSVALDGAALHNRLGVGATAAPAGTQLYVHSGAAGDRPLAVRAAVGQTANLVEFLSSDGTTVAAKVTAGGGFVTLGSTALGSEPLANVRHSLVGTVAGDVVSVVRAAASQTADLVQWQNSTPTILSRINNAGNFGIGTDVIANTPLALTPRATSGVGLIVKGLGSQTGALTRWLSSADAELAAVSALGRVNAAQGFFGGVVAASNPSATSNHLRSVAAGDVALSVQGFTGQTADLFRVLDVAGTGTLSKFDSTGALTAPNGSFIATNAALNLLTVKGASSQTAKLLVVKNNADNELFSVNYLGKVFVKPVTNEAAPVLILRNADAASTNALLTAQNHDGSQNLFEVSSAGTVNMKTLGITGFFAADLISAVGGAFTVDSDRNLTTDGYVDADDVRTLGVSMPRGLIAEGTGTATVTSSGTEVTVGALSQVINVVSGRKYRVTVGGRFESDTASTPVTATIRMRCSSFGPAVIQSWDDYFPGSGNTGQTARVFSRAFQATGTGATTISFTITRTTGANGFRIAQPSGTSYYIEIEDIGG